MFIPNDYTNQRGRRRSTLLFVRPLSTMQSVKKIADYGSWSSPMTSDFITGGSCQIISELSNDMSASGKGAVYWLEQTYPDGRGVIVRRRGGANANETMTLPPFSCQNSVHEYGGGSFTVNDECIYMTTADGIYRQSVRDNVAAAPEPLMTAGSDEVRFADPCFAHNSIYCVREEHNAAGTVVVNTLVRIQCANRSIDVVAKGADFYASPRVSVDGRQLVWMQWNHPNMPWDSTEIWLADLDDNGQVSNSRQLLGDGSTNYMCPRWSGDGSLLCTSDVTDWWNVYRVNTQTGELIENIYPCNKEIGRPQWTFSDNRYACDATSNRVIIAVDGKLILKHLDEESPTISIDTGYAVHRCLRFGIDNQVFCIASSASKYQAVIRIDLKTKKTEVLREVRDSSELEIFDISIPELLTFPSDGNTCTGYFYAPMNRSYTASDHTLPPVLIMAHGGPTSATDASFDLYKQYFTSRGFAVFDVNYRGSTGNGRKYRDLLKRQWGIIDRDDVCNAARFLVDTRRADSNKLCITGGSAGGYIVLRCITVPDTFSAAVSIYGISDLEQFQIETHKFEAQYATQLIAAYPERADVYRDRSPINYLDEICCPVAFFHGLDDKVVPIGQAIAFHKAVLAKKLPTAFVQFPKEGHGFKQRANVQRCIDGSYMYLCRVLGIEPSADVPTNVIEIDNMDACRAGIFEK